MCLFVLYFQPTQPVVVVWYIYSSRLYEQRSSVLCQFLVPFPQLNLQVDFRPHFPSSVVTARESVY